MEREEIEKCPVSFRDWGTKERLEEAFKSYALIAAIVTKSIAESGRIKLKDICLVNETIRTLAIISNLAEKEQKRSCDQLGGSAEPSSR